MRLGLKKAGLHAPPWLPSQNCCSEHVASASVKQMLSGWATTEA